MGAAGRKSNHDFDADARKICESLLGLLADADLKLSLSRVAKKLAAVRASEQQPRQVASCRQRPRRPGWVLDAIKQVLADRGEPMQAREIHRAVEALVGEPVAWSSVKDALATHVSGTLPRFVRIGRGRYVLASISESARSKIR